MFDIYLKGLSVGLAYVAPIGVQNIFVINAAIKKNRFKSIYTALVVAFFDIALSLCCFFGIGVLITTFPVIEKIMLFVGGIVVAYIGKTIFFSINDDDDDSKNTSQERNIIASAFLVTFINPQALIDGTMLFGGNISSLADIQRSYFIMGSASASLLWFLSIAIILPFFKNKIGGNTINIINKICGLYLVFNGLSLLYKFIEIVFLY
jgi:L-lysine exporter family protein LysE/ArgO